MMTKEDITNQLTITKCDSNKGYVFISYSSKDKQKVIEEKIIPLQKKGLRVYCDREFDTQNRNWVERMEVNMEFCSAVLLFVSRNYLLSHAALLELLKALQEDKEIIPIYLEDKNNLFQYLQENLGSYTEKFVQMTPETKKKFNILAENYYGERYQALWNRSCSRLKGTGDLRQHYVIKVFQDILTSGAFQDNRFNGQLDDLEKTIRDAASRVRTQYGREVFEEPVARSQARPAAAEETPDPAPPEEQGKIYFFRKAKMRCESDSFTILAGSPIRKEPTTFRSRNKKLMEIYQEAIKTGKLISMGEESKYMNAVSDLKGFQSVSGAAKMVSGNSENGNMVWKDADGQCYGEIHKTETPQTTDFSAGEIYRFQKARIAYDAEKEQFTILAGSLIKAEPTSFRFRVAKLKEAYEKAAAGNKIVRCAGMPGYMEVKDDLYGGDSPSSAAKMVSGGSVNGKKALIEIHTNQSFGEIHREEEKE